jgi:hypothetical protein
MEFFGLCDNNVNEKHPFGLTPTLEAAERDTSQWKNTPVGGGSLECIRELLDDTRVRPPRHRITRRMKERITELQREIRIMELSLEYRKANPLFCMRIKEKLEVYYRELWRLRFGPEAFTPHKEPSFTFN